MRGLRERAERTACHATPMPMCASVGNPAASAPSAFRGCVRIDSGDADDEGAVAPCPFWKVNFEPFLFPLPSGHVDVDVLFPPHEDGQIGVDAAPYGAAFVGQGQIGIFTAELRDLADS